jgi:signal transduction histidine kinase
MAASTIKVLLVEDETAYAQAVREFLPAPCFHVRHAMSFGDARDCLANESFDVALLDLTLPDSSGLQTFTKLKNAAPEVPVLVISGMTDESLALRAVREGAQDYLMKGQMDGRTLERSVRYATERKAAVNTLRGALADLKCAHEELKAAQLKLVQAEKLEAVSTFAAGVAHEVRNPLQTLLMGLEYLGRHLPAADKACSSVVQDMVHAVNRADGIIRGLTEFAQHSKRQIREEDLSTILKQAVNAIEAELAQHPILLSCELAENLPRLIIDFRSLKHVFINLFMRIIRELQPEGGRIVARTFVSTLEGPLVLNGKTFSNFEQGETVLWAEIEIFPNRMGEHNSNAVTPPSNGFGLTVLKKIVELYGGVFESTRPEDTGGTRYAAIFRAVKDSAPLKPGSA